jgi:hypothetical protein
VSQFQRGEWVEIVGKTAADPYMIQMRSSVEIAEVIEGDGGTRYYVTVDAESPRRRYGPFAERRLRALPRRARG